MNAENMSEDTGDREDASVSSTAAPVTAKETSESPFYPSVKLWRLPANAVATSYAEMFDDGQHDREGIALWAGVRGADGVAEVTHVIVLRGNGVQRHRYFITITPDLLNDVTDALDDRGISLVGQIHSHPPDCTIDLSPTDVRYGIAVPGYLSVVAPDYAADPSPQPTDWGVHVYEPSRRWRRLSPHEVFDRVEIVTDRMASLLVLGGRASRDTGSADA